MAATTLQTRKTQRRMRPRVAALRDRIRSLMTLLRGHLRARWKLYVSAVIAILSVCIGYGFGREYNLERAMHAENVALYREIQMDQIRGQSAERDIRSLATRPGVDRAARKLGWTNRGERRLRIPVD